MQIDGISTLVMGNVLKEAVRRSQQDLAAAQIEYTTGRHADMGLALGAATGRDLTWRAQMAELQSLSDGNKLASTRLDLTQQALGGIREAAGAFLSALTAARGAGDGQETAKAAARQALDAITGLLNTNFGGQYLFGGIASGQPPLRDYPGSPPGPAKAAVDSAFAATFGIGQAAPGVGGIAAFAMQSFLATQFSALFAPGAWSASWSQASDTGYSLRVDSSEVIDASATANAQPFRDLAQAFTMVLDLGEGGLNEGAFQAVADAALKLVGQGIYGVGGEQARLGTVQGEVAAATQRIGLRLAAITGGVTRAEAVDQYEAATRVSALQTQLEASYTLTGRIGRLSLLNYL